MVMQTNAEQATSSFAPINQLVHTDELRNADTKSVVTPNVDTLYSTAWLDISEEPIIYTTPETNRFMQTQVLDGWSNTTDVINEGGQYMIATPDQTVDTPDGVTRIDVPTSMVWFICRPILNSNDDLPNVLELQNKMSLTPLSEYDNSTEYIPPKGTFKEENRYIPVDKVNSMDAITFFNKANELLLENPPTPEDSDLINRISILNIGAGMKFDSTSISSDQKELEDIWDTLKKDCYSNWSKSVENYSLEIGHWTYMGDPVGDFGTAYEYRAATALNALGANPVYVAMYLEATVNDTGTSLNGENTYIIHFDEVPPVLDKGFWSITMYGDDNFLVDNEINRYVINDRSDIAYNQDGSFDITISTTPPEYTANWLPSPSDGFHLWFRIYSPDTDVIYNNWTPPTIKIQ